MALFGFLPSCTGFPKVVETVHKSFHGFVVASGPDAFSIRDAASVLEEELFPQGSRIHTVPTISGRDAGSDLVLVLIPFIHRPKCPTLRAGTKPNPIAGILSLQNLFKTTGALVEVKGIRQLGAFASHILNPNGGHVRLP
jgi:hypothetical protein